MKIDSEPRDVNPIRILSGALLIYLSWKLLSAVINKETTNVALSIVFFVVFLLVGGTLVFFEVRAYLRYTKKAKGMKEEETGSEPCERIDEK